tara:strand:- start:1844 stop:2044 length:201 start_codon:yes stop_codon:yes gene_type:complete
LVLGVGFAFIPWPVPGSMMGGAWCALGHLCPCAAAGFQPQIREHDLVLQRLERAASILAAIKLVFR